MDATRIMVVEDEHIVAMDIRSQLADLGYEVVASATRGQEAIDKAARWHPDLALMDIHLRGEMDGIEAASAIQGQMDIPVVYLTAYVDTDTLERAKQTEPYGYIAKPFEDRDLQTAIEVALYKFEMERRVRDGAQWLDATLRSIGDAVIATDARGAIQFVNPVAASLTGWSQLEAIGVPFEQVFRVVDSQTRQPLVDPVARVLDSSEVVRLEEGALLLARNGAETPISDSAAPIVGHLGVMLGVVLVFQDITEQIAAQERQRQYAATLEARNAELDAFAHTVAHDIKDPLNTMISCATLLREQDADLDQEQRDRVLGIMEQVGFQTCDIVDELLLMSAVRSAEVQPEPLHMGEIIARAERRLAYLRESSGAEIAISDRWPAATGYGPWVEEVWVNYISNAIKYGGRPARVELGATVQPNRTVRFWVRDNGAGIAAADQAGLFTPFTQLKHIRGTGHGLGLSIVRRIVEKLGGQVGVESEAGRGSTFYFVLPAL